VSYSWSSGADDSRGARGLLLHHAGMRSWYVHVLQSAPAAGCNVWGCMRAVNSLAAAQLCRCLYGCLWGVWHACSRNWRLASCRHARVAFCLLCNLSLNLFWAYGRFLWCKVYPEANWFAAEAFVQGLRRAVGWAVPKACGMLSSLKNKEAD
jgi:hypothetical protein